MALSVHIATLRATIGVRRKSIALFPLEHSLLYGPTIHLFLLKKQSWLNNHRGVTATLCAAGWHRETP
jgi:hypothetical protein